jgi:hypothetical protein
MLRTVLVQKGEISKESTVLVSVADPLIFGTDPVPLTNGSRFCSLCHSPSRRQQKVFQLSNFRRYIYIIFQR